MSTVEYSAILAVIIVVASNIATAAPPYGGGPYPTIPTFDVCEEVGVCGRGTCVHVTNNTLGFVCECEEGWRQARLEEDQFLKFLPCVIPNCTIDITCTDADNPRNPDDEYYRPSPDTSYLDPCAAGDCGGGKCRVNETAFTRICECEDGYYNLLNSTIFPCYRKCAFGNDCPGIGYNTSTSIIDPNPVNYSHGTRLIGRAEIGCFITMATILVRSLWLNDI